MIEGEHQIDATAQGLMQVARTVLADLDLDVVLERVLASARQLTGARYAALGVLDERKEQLSRFITAGIDDASISRIERLPTGRGVLGELIIHPAPLRLEAVRAHPRSYGFPPGHPPMTTFLGVPILIAGEPWGNLYLTEKVSGGPFLEADEQAVVLLAELAALAIDHARRFSGTESRRRELQRSVEALEATMEIAAAVAGRRELEAVLELVANRGRALVSARILAIEVQEGPDLVVAAAAGELPEDFIGLRFAATGTVASTAVHTQQTQQLSDPANLTRFRERGLGRYHPESEDGLVVPMTFRGESYGVLVALDRFGGPGFELEHQRLLEAFAASAAVVVATARGVADERRRHVIAAAEAERGRWARELHDDTLQAIASVRLMLSAARRLDDPHEMRRAIEEATGELQISMDDLRSLIADLRPGALDQLGVEPALADLADRFGRTGIELDCHLDLAYEHGRAPQRLLPELETAIYRTVQEALTNVVKHSGASRTMVEVIETEQQVSVRVRDNGRGFDPESQTDGFGLLGMRERVELVDGELELESAPGAGTTICASFPAQRPHRATSSGSSASRR